MTEIERKFLVTSEAFKKDSTTQYRIVQAFLNTHPERTVRIRIKGQQAFITVKGIGNATGTSRFEWEKPISIEDAEALLPLCEPGMIEKTRYEIKSGKHIIEVDEFFGQNQGLILAEIELEEENQPFLKPNWLGKEVTGENRYYNSQLSKNPFNLW